MVNWDDDDVKQFKIEARATQQEFCDQLGDREWDLIERWDWTILYRKVGFGLYGPPNEEPTDENKSTGYTKKQLDVIVKISNQLVGNKNREILTVRYYNLHFACIFLVLKVYDKSYSVPVFKAKRDYDSSFECVFVDAGARKYSSWESYLSENTIDKAIYCYPLHGLYETNKDNEVCVQFGTTPACKLVRRVFSFFDKAATVCTIAATGVGVAALCTVPIAGPIAAATVVASVSTGAYGVTRSSYALYDRANHNQSIALNNSEAIGCWLTIVGSSLGFAQGRMIASMTKAARAGEVMGKAGRIAFLAVQTGSLTVNGIGIVHGLAVIVDKKERGELTALDVFQFTSSVLFYTNAVVNVKTAGTIIKEVQHEVIDSHRQVLSKRATKLFDKQTRKLRGPNEMHGNAKVVKQLNRIENSKDLYEMMSNKNVDNHKVRLTDTGFKGLLQVNKNLKVHPLKLLEIPPESRQAIFNSTRNFSKGSITKAEFHNEMKPICKNHRIAFQSMRKDTKQILCQLYGKENVNEIVVGGRKIFANASSHDVDRLRVVLENTVQNTEIIFERATEFAKTRACANVTEFIAYTEYFVADLNDSVKSYEASYQKDLAVAKQKPNFSQVKFDEDRGIGSGMKRVAHHKQKALDRFSSTKGYEELNQRYDALKSKVTPCNKKCQVGFFGDDSATYHWFKHKNFGSLGELTPEEYFKLAEEVVGNPTNKTNSMLSQDGTCVLMTYLEPQRGVRAIMIDRADRSGIATVIYDRSVATYE